LRERSGKCLRFGNGISFRSTAPALCRGWRSEEELHPRQRIHMHIPIHMEGTCAAAKRVKVA